MKTLLKILIPIVILAAVAGVLIITITAEKPTIHKSQHLVKRKMKNQLLVNRRLCITIINLRLIKTVKKKTVELNEYRDQPLRMKAYLKLKVNPRKGVISGMK